MLAPTWGLYNTNMHKSRESQIFFEKLHLPAKVNILQYWQRNFTAKQYSRPIPDEAICAFLWEYKDRGRKGYDLTEKFFLLLKEQFPDYMIEGPERAGKDILLGSVFKDYPIPKRPVDFVIYNKKKEVLAVGLARYDSDRGGAQEDDRTGGYKNCADEILTYCRDNELQTKVVFLNDGPGLLLGSMWTDYSEIESRWKDKIMVLTLRMVASRLTRNWLEDREA
jgi:hypothetical protein